MSRQRKKEGERIDSEREEDKRERVEGGTGEYTGDETRPDEMR